MFRFAPSSSNQNQPQFSIINALKIRANLAKTHDDLADLIKCYANADEEEKPKLIEQIKALREQIENLEERLEDYKGQFFDMQYGLSEKRNIVNVRKILVQFTNLRRALHNLKEFSESNKELEVLENEEKNTEELFNALLPEPGKLSDDLWQELNREWSIIVREYEFLKKKVQQLAEKPLLSLSGLSNTQDSECKTQTSARKLTQTKILSQDTDPQETALVLKDNLCEHLKALEKSYRELTCEQDLENISKIGDKIKQYLANIKSIQPCLMQRYKEYLSRNSKLELETNILLVDVARILWIFNELKKSLDELCSQESIKNGQLITTIENRMENAIVGYMNLLFKYRKLPYNQYQELSRKWQAVRTRYTLLPYAQEAPELPGLASLSLGAIPFLVTHSRRVVNELINSPITKRLKFLTQQTGSPTVVNETPLLILGSMIFAQGYTPTIENIKNLCRQYGINLNKLCVINCVESPEMGQVRNAKPATKEDWEKEGFSNVSQLNIANRTFLISCGYNIGDQELFKPYTASDLMEITERINGSPSLVYCSAAKSRSVVIAAAAMFKRYWDDNRQYFDNGDTKIQFCSISSVIKYLHILRPESTKDAIEDFSDAGQSLTLLLFCWRLVHQGTELIRDERERFAYINKINEWLNQDYFIHDIEITLNKLIAPSTVEKQLLALPESLEHIKNFVNVLNKLPKDKLDKLLRKALHGQNYCHFLTKLFEILEIAEPSEMVMVRTIFSSSFSILIENPKNTYDTLKSMYQTVQGDELVFAIRLAHMYFGLLPKEREIFKDAVMPQINNKIGKIIYGIFSQAIQPHEEKMPQDIDDPAYSYIGKLIKNQTIFVNSPIKEAARNLVNNLSKMKLFPDPVLASVSQQIENLLGSFEIKFDKPTEEYSYNTVMTQMIISYGKNFQEDNQYELLHNAVVKCINIFLQDNFGYPYISKEKLLEDLLYFQISEEYCTDLTSHLLQLIDNDTEIIETTFRRTIELFKKRISEKEDDKKNGDDEKKEIFNETDDERFKKELECKLLAVQKLPYYQIVKNHFFPNTPHTYVEESDIHTQLKILRYMYLAVVVISEIENDKIALNRDAKRTIVDVLYTKTYPSPDFNDYTMFQTALSNVDEELPNVKRHLFQNIASSVNESLTNGNKVDDQQLKLLQALVEKGNYEASDADQLFENLVVYISEYPTDSEAEQELARTLFESIDITQFENMNSFLSSYVNTIRKNLFISNGIIVEVKNKDSWLAIFYSANILVRSKKIISISSISQSNRLFTSIINLITSLSNKQSRKLFNIKEIKDKNSKIKTYSLEISANNRDKFKTKCDHVFCIIMSIVDLQDNFFTQSGVVHGILGALNKSLTYCLGTESLKDWGQLENAYFSSLNIIYGELKNLKKQQVTQDKILAVTEIMREFCYNVYQIRKTIDFYIEQARAQIELKRQAQTTEGSKGDRATAIELLTDELTRLYFYSLTHYPDKLEQFINKILKYDCTLKEQGGNTYLISLLRKFIYHNYDLNLNNFKDFLLIISVLLNNEKCCVELIILENDDTQKLIDLLLDDKKFRYFNISQFDQSYLIGKCLLCMDNSIFGLILGRNDIQQKIPFILSTFTPNETQAFHDKFKNNKVRTVIRNDVLQNSEKEVQNETLNNKRLTQEIQDFNTYVTVLNTKLKQLPISTVNEEELFQISGQIIFCQFHINSLRQKQRILGSHNNIELDAYKKLIKYLSQRLDYLCPEKDHYLDLLMMHLNQQGNSEEVNNFVIQLAQRMNPNTLSSNALNKAKQTLHKIINSECLDINTLYLFFIAEIRSMTWKNPEESNKRRSDINEQDHVANMPSLQKEKDELEQFVKTQFSDLDAPNKKSFYEKRVPDEDVLLHLMKHGESTEIREFVNRLPKDKKRDTIVKAVEKYNGKVRPVIEERIEMWLNGTFIKITDFCRVVSFDYFLKYLKKYQNKIPEVINSFKSWLIDNNYDYIKRCLDVIKNETYKSSIVKLIIGVFANGEKVNGPQAMNLIKEWYEKRYIEQDQFKNVVSEEYFAKYCEDKFRNANSKFTEEINRLIDNKLLDKQLDENLRFLLKILKGINKEIENHKTKIVFFKKLIANWTLLIPNCGDNLYELYNKVNEQTDALVQNTKNDDYILSEELQNNLGTLHTHVVIYFTIIAVIALSQNSDILQIESLKNLGIPVLDLKNIQDKFSNVISRIISNDELPIKTRYRICLSIIEKPGGILKKKPNSDSKLAIIESLPPALKGIITKIVDEVLHQSRISFSPKKKKVETDKKVYKLEGKLRESHDLYLISDVNNKLAIDIVSLIYNQKNLPSEAKEKIINCLYDLIKRHALEGLQPHQLYRRILIEFSKLSPPLYMSIQLASKIIADFLLSKSQNDFDSISVLLCGIEFCCEDFENRSYSIFSFFAQKLQELMSRDITHCLVSLVSRYLLECLGNISKFVNTEGKKAIENFTAQLQSETKTNLQRYIEYFNTNSLIEKNDMLQALKLPDIFEEIKLANIPEDSDEVDNNTLQKLIQWMNDYKKINNDGRNSQQTYYCIFIQLNKFYLIRHNLIWKLHKLFISSHFKTHDFLESIILVKTNVVACKSVFRNSSNEEQKSKYLQQLQELVEQEFIDRTVSVITLGNLGRAFELLGEYRPILKECYLEDSVAQMMISALTSSESDEKVRIEEAIKIAQNYLLALVRYGLTHKLAVDFPQVINRLMDNANQKLEQQTAERFKNELVKMYSFEVPLQEAVNQWASVISKTENTGGYYDHRQLFGIDINPISEKDEQDEQKRKLQNKQKRKQYKNLASELDGKFVPVNQAERKNDRLELFFENLKSMILPDIKNEQMRNKILLLLLDQHSPVSKIPDLIIKMIEKAAQIVCTREIIKHQYPSIIITSEGNTYTITYSGSFKFFVKNPNECNIVDNKFLEKKFRDDENNMVTIHLIQNQDGTVSITLQDFEYSIEFEDIQMKFYLPKFPLTPTPISQSPSIPQACDDRNSDGHPLDDSPPLSQESISSSQANLATQGLFAANKRDNQKKSCGISNNTPQP